MNIFYTKCIISIFNFLGDAMESISLLLKIYRLLCFAKVTFDQLPLYNPYKWPLSFIRVATKPYLSFWGILLPNIKIGVMSYEVSTLVALEFLSSLIYSLYYIHIYVIIKADELSKLIS